MSYSEKQKQLQGEQVHYESGHDLFHICVPRRAQVFGCKTGKGALATAGRDARSTGRTEPDVTHTWSQLEASESIQGSWDLRATAPAKGTQRGKLVCPESNKRSKT